MINKIFAIVALVSLAGFISIVIGFVPEIDLIIVMVLVILMAAYDFLKDAFSQGENND